MVLEELEANTSLANDFFFVFGTWNIISCIFFYLCKASQSAFGLRLFLLNKWNAVFHAQVFWETMEMDCKLKIWRWETLSSLIFPPYIRQRALQVGYGLQRRKIVLHNQHWSLNVQSERYSNMFFFSGIDSMSQSYVRGVRLTFAG